MRETALILLLAAGLSACAINDLLSAAAPDIRRYSRILVAPFDDRDGLGRLYARDILRELSALRFSPVSLEQADEAVSRLKISGGGALSAQDISALRQETQADAVLSGAVDCGSLPAAGRPPAPARVSFILQDAAGGETILKGSFSPKACGSTRDVRPIAAEVGAAFKRELSRMNLEGL
ncbi:MAG: hypothetical protein HY922_06410 [Elusimicrobia bacterium]|nr:hypothetical protein [Elusimicrobiota bacterium]